MPQGRTPPAREAEAVGEKAELDLQVLTEAAETQARSPRNGDA